MAYTDHYINKISMESASCTLGLIGHQGHKMRSKRLVNLLQGKNPRLQRSGFIPSNYSRKRGPDGKAQASFQWAEADNLLKGGMAPGGQSTSPARGTASKSDCT